MPAINPISQSNQFEFNDSVLTTKAWNSLRYDGRQLSGSKLNKFTAGDSSYGLTPVIRNLSRTFYISSDITSLSNTGLRIDRVSGDEVEDTEYPIEDPTLQFIPGFSYILINKAVTINDDNSIKVTDLSTFNTSPGGADRRKGFDREFQTNIPNGSFIGIKNLDADIKDRTDVSYPVYFNGGRLQPMWRNIYSDEFQGGGADIEPRYDVDTNELRFARTTNLIGVRTTVLNRKRAREYYTSSFTLSGTYTHPAGGYSVNIFRGLQTAKSEPPFPRFFVSLLHQSESIGSNIDPYATDITPIRTVEEAAATDGSTLHQTKNLAEISTAEFSSVITNLTQHTASFNIINNLNQSYSISAPSHFSGSYDISYLNENKPALLVNLTKEVEFPEGLGRTPLVIIPETLHPYIRDNIPQFMARAGFDIGNITQINTLDETNRTLP